MENLKPKHLTPGEVQYLTFEGGGGKGVTFLGAIRELEHVKVLPIKRGGPIRGVSGSSAGAITALMLAMGMDSSQLGDLLFAPEKQELFLNFFWESRTGVLRTVRDNEPGSWDLLANPSAWRRAKDLGSTVALLPWIPEEILLKAALGWFMSGSVYKPITDQLTKSMGMYVANLLCDRGLFHGLGVRTFFEIHIGNALGDALGKRHLVPGKLNFEQFFEITGVNLVVTGTNISRQRPAYFSALHTPMFPVAEAVAISMNIPVLFKPVVIESPDELAGFWVDGGLLNNLPIHAFDDPRQQAFWQCRLAKEPTDTQSLNPHVLAFRLSDGYAPPKPFKDSKGVLSYAKESLKKSVWSPFFILKQYLAELAGSLMYPAEEGQLRTRQEHDQTIELFCHELATGDFTPKKDLYDPPIAAAQEAVKAYWPEKLMSEPPPAGKR